jgi:hypothetical protein
MWTEWRTFQVRSDTYSPCSEANCCAGAIVQGRYDILTPPRTAWNLHKLWPKAELHWIDAAGHSANVSLKRQFGSSVVVLMLIQEAGTTEKLIEVCDRLSKLGREASS